MILVPRRERFRPFPVFRNSGDENIHNWRGLSTAGCN